MRFHLLLAAALALLASARADILDLTALTRDQLDEAALTSLSAARAAPPTLATFADGLNAPTARALWTEALARATHQPGPAELGALKGAFQTVLALEMLHALAAGDPAAARQWRAAIRLPKHASAVEGLLALQRIGTSPTQREEVRRLLARETLVWAGASARERADDLLRLARAGRATPRLVALRAAEITALADFPPALLEAAGVAAALPPAPALPGIDPTSLTAWKSAVEHRLPDLLTPADVTRQERLVLKLLRLVPMEYRAGVRDGQIAIPLEYREAVTFTVQAQQILVEIRPNWLRTKSAALAAHGPTLDSLFAALEVAIARRADSAIIDQTCSDLSTLLQREFDLSLRKAGKGSDVVQETALEVRTLLGESLQAARAGQWRQAEALRLEAYTTFDLEIETRVLPRDPGLANRAERSFLDGSTGQPGIKTLLDQRTRSETLDAAYARTLSALDECVALLRVGLAPATVALTAFTIVLREGLEAVVILAALLAGLRGPENTAARRQIGLGAWGAIAASVLTFVLARTIISSLSRYGETLEAVISLLAVLILLIVTNWVFHKYYWTGWNARLRELKDQAATQRGRRWPGGMKGLLPLQSLAMVGVGFLTIYREGFETTLFLQSLILEGGFRASLLGLAAGLGVIALAGWAIFRWGKKLPYRKLLVVTGLLIVSILGTFLGSTVRLFQTIGWLPIHPIEGLDIPAWMGTWLGLYPSWEGLLIPLLGFAYVGGAWLFVRWQGTRQRQLTPAPATIPPLTPAT